MRARSVQNRLNAHPRACGGRLSLPLDRRDRPRQRHGGNGRVVQRLDGHGRRTRCAAVAEIPSAVRWQYRDLRCIPHRRGVLPLTPAAKRAPPILQCHRVPIIRPAIEGLEDRLPLSSLCGKYATYCNINKVSNCPDKLSSEGLDMHRCKKESNLRRRSERHALTSGAQAMRIVCRTCDASVFV